MKAIQSTLPALALLALPLSATAATVVTNNTGLDASTFRFIDLESGATGAANRHHDNPGRYSHDHRIDGRKRWGWISVRKLGGLGGK